jgi:hypothetical protein
VNGILQRADWEEAIKMPIGMVPAGTNNFILGKITVEKLILKKTIKTNLSL